MMESISKTQEPVRVSAALIVTTLLFAAIYSFIPNIWETTIIPSTSSLPMIFFDIAGSLGVAMICFALLALKADVIDKNGMFVFFAISSLGSFLHLISFSYEAYYNPYGVTLDLVFAAAGIRGMIKTRGLYYINKDKLKLWFSLVAIPLILFMSIYYTIWISGWAPQWEHSILEILGWIAGIGILATFIGQNLGWMDVHETWFKNIYLTGVICYVIMLFFGTFNPFTLALESVLIVYFLYPIRNVMQKILLTKNI